MMADLKEVGVILRSILTSAPGTTTISEVLRDYKNLEGTLLPVKQLGFNTVYELLNCMGDVLTIPRNPNIDSPVRLVVDHKSSHIRELVVNQKNKKRSFKSMHKKSYHVGSSYSSKNFGYPIQSNHNARGYDYVKQKSFNSSTYYKKTVPESLKSDLEEIINESVMKSISVHVLRRFLITHSDYSKLRATCIEEAINMLKYFIYIDKGGVHLKETYNGAFSPKKPEINNFPKSNIIDDLEEMSNDDKDDNNYGLEQDSDSSFEDSNKLNFNNPQPNNSETIISQENKENIYKASTILPDKSLDDNVKQQIVLKENDKEANDPYGVEATKYQNMIASIITRSRKPITVKELLKMFQIRYGYSFPFEKLKCRTYMDFFRLFPDLFQLDDPYSISSFIKLIGNKTTPERKTTTRPKYIMSSILNCFDYLDTWDNRNYIASPSSEYETTVQDINNANFTRPAEMCDSDSVIPSMKDKMRKLLTKHYNGIYCNEFMDIYGGEYSNFTFEEYGFKSMKDMAYRLPSVFYVKVTENNECILFHADRRNELDFCDPLLHYKNIPKTVLANLSKFFNDHKEGVNFDDLKTLYCTEFGRSYEPLKYGYSSERNMFESLNKMVKIQNDFVKPIDPFAYNYFVKPEDTPSDHRKNVSVLTDNNFLMNSSDKDICNGKHVYPEFNIEDNVQSMEVVSAEIYDPSSFYIQKASQVDTLNNLMSDLQEFYNKNEDLYKTSPEYLFPGLVCTARFTETMEWHRGIILEVLQKNRVRVLYVDFGSIESIPKSSVRLLNSRFGNIPIMSLHCSMFDIDDVTTYTLEVNESFADMIDGKLLEAKIGKNKIFINFGIEKKLLIGLYMNTPFERINVKKQCVKLINKWSYKYENSIRRIITIFQKEEDMQVS